MDVVAWGVRYVLTQTPVSIGSSPPTREAGETTSLGFGA
ncbi:hypothetical protein RHOER0001_3965 [Rhodococcus erythropolis SK121]|nr:hypothetical protein RHOER0001_3965 [Rhodococcus erythropolis SK121]